MVWIDAHPDLNTPDSSPSGAFSGMVLRAVLGPEAALILHERDNLEDLAQVQGRPASETWIDALRASGGAPADADGLGV